MQGAFKDEAYAGILSAIARRPSQCNSHNQTAAVVQASMLQTITCLQPVSGGHESCARGSSGSRRSFLCRLSVSFKDKNARKASTSLRAVRQRGKVDREGGERARTKRVAETGRTGTECVQKQSPGCSSDSCAPAAVKNAQPVSCAQERQTLQLIGSCHRLSSYYRTDTKRIQPLVRTYIANKHIGCRELAAGA